MVETFVIQNHRQTGKTWAIMSEIHDLILDGHKENVIVYGPNHEWLYHWTRMWRERFNVLPFPDYVLGDNFLGVRSRLYRYVFVDDVDFLEDGIRSDVLQYIHAMKPEQITFTATTAEYRPAHNDYVPKHQSLRLRSKSVMQSAARFAASPSA